MKKDGKYITEKKNFFFLFCNLIAVQKERDRLGRQRHSNYTYRIATIKSIEHINRDLDDDEDDLSIMALLRAEKTAKEVLTKNKNKIFS